MTIKQALKNLYTAMCGGTTNKDGTAAIIGDIADNYTGGGGGSLPAVGNEGDVMTVVSGAWGSAAPSKPMYVDGEMGEGTVTITDELADIKAAYDADRPVYLRFMGAIAPLVSCYGDGEGIVADFVGTFFGENDDEAFLVGVKFYESKTGTMEFLDSRPDVPKASASYNYKVLGVSGGNYQFVDMPLIVKFEVDAETHAISADMSVNNIIDAAATRPVLGVLPLGGSSEMLCYAQGGAGTVCFTIVDTDGATNRPKSITCLYGVYDGNTQTDAWDTEDCLLLPTVSNAVAGYVLKVNASGDGVEWVSPT